MKRSDEEYYQELQLVTEEYNAVGPEADDLRRHLELAILQQEEKLATEAAVARFFYQGDLMNGQPPLFPYRVRCSCGCLSEGETVIMARDEEEAFHEAWVNHDNYQWTPFFRVPDRLSVPEIIKNRWNN